MLTSLKDLFLLMVAFIAVTFYPELSARYICCLRSLLDCYIVVVKLTSLVTVLIFSKCILSGAIQ